jgi:hypothetical protein
MTAPCRVLSDEHFSVDGTPVAAWASMKSFRAKDGARRLALGADKAYDVREFVDDLRDLNITPHIAQNTTNRTSAIDAQTTRHPAMRSANTSASEPNSRSAGPRLSAGLAREVQVHSDIRV